MSDAGAPFRITFVCTGNTCRSPMAEAVARTIVAERGLSGVTVRSAGTHALQGQPASEGARAAAAAAGLDLAAHRSTQFTPEIAAASDLVLCMTEGQLWHVGEAAAGRALLLAEMAGGGADDVADPFGGSREVYEASFAEIAALVHAAMERISLP